MLFPTLPFALFFLLVLTGSWAVRRSRTSQKTFLLVASYFFYACWTWRFAALLLLSSVFNYLAGEALARGRRQRAILVGAVLANVGLLGFFKYYGFFQESLTHLTTLLGLQAHLPVLQVILPVGISFYTFQNIAYLIDLARGRGVRAESLLDYLLFAGFFPQLVAGPICRSRDLLPQIMGPGPNRIPDLSRAVSLVLSGLFKKMVLATLLGTHLVDDAFASPENYTSLELLVAVYGYSALVYCDFSGYTDLARGIGLLLGFHLPENFDRPLAATSIGDFWRRWHMTFSHWLRDYVYFPLGGSRVKPLRCYLNLMITFLLGGLWHGAHWKFVLWGAVHGGALTLQKGSRDLRRVLGITIPDQPARHLLVLGWVYTFHLCAFVRILFRCPDLSTARTYVVQLTELTCCGKGIELSVLVAIVVAIGINFVGAPIRNGFIAWHEKTPALAWPAAWAALLICVLALAPSGVAPYVYFQF